MHTKQGESSLDTSPTSQGEGIADNSRPSTKPYRKKNGQKPNSFKVASTATRLPATKSPRTLTVWKSRKLLVKVEVSLSKITVSNPREKEGL